MRTFAAAAFTLLLAPCSFGLLPEFVQKTAVELPDIRAVYSSDFNGDGRADVIVHNTVSAWMLAGRADGTLSAPVKIFDGDYLLSAGVADMNDDGRADFIVYDSGTYILSVLTSNADGTFTTPTETILTDRATRFVVLDLNADGVNDLVLCTNQNFSDSTITVLRGAGNGTFTKVSSQTVAGTVMSMSVADFDRDGRDDVEITEGDLHRHDVYFGAADGNLEPPVTVAGAATSSSSTKAADLDGDGYEDLVSAEFKGNTVTVIRNLGSRQWAPPVSYDVFDEPVTSSNPSELSVGDVSGDGKPDVAVILSNARSIATLQGVGDDTLTGATHTPVEPFAYPRPFPVHLSLGDVDGDGRLDVVATTSATAYGVVPFINASGEVTVVIQSDHPVVTTGQTVTVTARIYLTPGATWPGSPASPSPGGDLVIESGANVLARGKAVGSVGTFELTSLPAGEYSLTARLEADANYKTATSTPIAQTVTDAATRLVLTSSTGGAAVPYGHGVTLTLEKTSELAGTIDGKFWLYTDDVASGYAVGSGPYSTYAPAGTHTYRVVYDGNSTFPPAASNTVTQVISKATTETSLYNSGSGSVYTSVRPQYSGAATGLTTIYDWRSVIGSAAVGAWVDLTSLSPGTHYLRAEYEGDSNCERSSSTVLPFLVAGNGFSLEVSASNGMIRAAATGAPAGTQSFLIEQRIGTGAWSVVAQNSYYASWTESAPSASTPYTYRINALGSQNQVLAVTNIDTAMLVSFTDDPLDINTPAKALHLTELLAAINTFRAAVALPAATISDAATGDLIRASHIVRLYTAVNEARAVLGATPIAVPGDLVTGSMLRMQHLQNLRDALH